MKTGIVILNYNDSKTTIDLLNRIKNYDMLDEIVVVDNNSTDNSIEKLKKYENNNIKLIVNKENKGYGAGNNIGCKYLAQKNVDYIIISNPDVVFTNEDIQKLCDSFNSDIAIVAPVVDEHGILNRGWKFETTFVDSLSNYNYVGRWFKKRRLYKNEYYNKKLSKVDVVSGCFFMARKDIFEKIGFFDENTFLYYEENIIAKKIKNEGKCIYINNDVKIIHKHSVSVDKSLKKIKKFKILAKSQRYYHKNYNNASLIGMAELYFSYYITLVISYILSIFRK